MNNIASPDPTATSDATTTTVTSFADIDMTAELRQDPAYLRHALLQEPNEPSDQTAGSAAPVTDDDDELPPFPAPDRPRPVLDDAALHGPAGEIVRRLAPHTEADPAAMYAQLLVGVGSLIGRGAWFVADGARHHPNLYTIIVGRTAKSRKGTSWERVEHVLKELDELWFSTRVKSGVVSGEGVIQAFQDDEQDKRLLLVEGEFGQVLQCMKREGNTVSVLLRNGWDGKPLAVMRRKDPLRVEGAHLSMAGHITYSELQRLLNSVDISNGLANRCLWVIAVRSQLLPEGGDTPDLEAPLDQLHASVTTARTRGRLLRDSAAGRRWKDIYAELSAEPEGALGEVLCRGEAQVMRVALLLALLDQSPAIECRHLDAALAFWRYCEASATYLFEQPCVNPKTGKILEALRQHGPLSMRQIHKLFNNRASKTELAQAFAEIQEKIHVERGGARGAVSVRLLG